MTTTGGRLRAARKTWWWTVALLATYLLACLAGTPWLGWLLLGADLLLFGFDGFLPTGPPRSTVTPEEAWDNGMQYGVRLARDVIADYAKPYITLGEERGWDLARGQLVQALEELVDEVHIGELARP